MNYKELILDLVEKKGRVELNGNVVVDSIWDGHKYVHYYGYYIDKNGVYSCPDYDADNVDCYTPIDVVELIDKTVVELFNDIVE